MFAHIIKDNKIIATIDAHDAAEAARYMEHEYILVTKPIPEEYQAKALRVHVRGVIRVIPIVDRA